MRVLAVALSLVAAATGAFVSSCSAGGHAGGAGALGVVPSPSVVDATSVNLVKNGSFEKPVVQVGGFTGFSTGQSFSNWTVVGAAGNVAVVSGTFTQNGFSFPAHAGKQWLDLTGESDSATGVAQTVPTTNGASYTLTFWIGNVDDPGGIFGTTSTVDVQVDGSQVFSATNRRGSGQTKMVWQKFSTTVKATSSSTTIGFINADPSSDTLNGLDSISLVKI